jgi:plasmid stabilization system protein ParE
VKIKWTKRAKNSFDQTVDHLQKEWSLTSAINFVKKANNFIETLKDQPKIGKPEIARRDLRSFVLTRQTTVFYRIKDNEVIILLKFFSTRQHPSKKLE